MHASSTCHAQHACSLTAFHINKKNNHMHTVPILNAYMLTLSAIHEKIASGGDQPRRKRCALHAEGQAGTLTTEYIATDTVSAPRVIGNLITISI